MSLLKWKELAKRKTELANKINYVHDIITQHKIGEQTSQGSLAKVFKPVTSKLDDVIDSNLNLRIPQRRRRPPRKMDVPNYGIDIEDEVEDMGIGVLFDEQPVLPESEKQLVPKPPTYEKSFEDLLKGNKGIYINPQYFPQDPEYLQPEEPPPEYDEDEGVDYAMDDRDLANKILDNIGIQNYEDIDYQLKQPEMTPQKNKKYLKSMLKNAKLERNKLKGKKSNVTKKYNKGEIFEAEKQVENKNIDDTRAVLNDYIHLIESKLQTMKGSGIKGRGRKQRGGNVVFFNDVKQLLNKLELIIGEIIAGNTNSDEKYWS